MAKKKKTEDKSEKELKKTTQWKRMINRENEKKTFCFSYISKHKCKMQASKQPQASITVIKANGGATEINSRQL